MYSELVSILNRCFRGRWFLDSGSLLGVIRDGCFLKQDMGIDISVLVDSYSEEAISEAVMGFKKLGFIASPYEWNGIVYKYCFAPPLFSTFKYAVDFHLFVLNGDHYSCPQISLMIDNKIALSFAVIKKGDTITFRHSFSSLIKVFVSGIYRYVFRYFGQPVRMDKYYKKEQGKCYMWDIPCKLYHGTQTGSFQSLAILKEPEEYLGYRYGNWRVPNSNWVTLRDDGGIRPSSKEEIDCLLYGD